MLATALALVLAMGALSYATGGRFPLGGDELGPRLGQAFPELAVPRTWIVGARFGDMDRRNRPTGVARMLRWRRRTSRLRKRIAAAAAELKPSARAGPAEIETETSKPPPLEERIAAATAGLEPNRGTQAVPTEPEIETSEPAPVEETPALDSSEANPEATPASTSNPADDELEILKAKLGRSPAPVGGESPDEVETLKAKLAGEAAATEGDAETRDVLKTKLVERPSSPKSLPRETGDVDSLKTKLDVRDEAASGQAPVSIDLEARRRGRAPTVSGGSTAQWRGSNRGERTALGAAPHLEPVPPLPHPPESPGRSEEPQPVWSECRIAWWRGYVKSAFHAVTTTPGGEEQLIAESPFFGWRKPEPPPQSGPVEEALRTLVDRLQGDGWSVVGAGEHWFALRLQRPAVNADASRSGGGNGSADR